MEDFHVIDLRSDTVTKPSQEMRQAMATAEVGDDVYGEDPTVKQLEAYTAKLFKKEAALFVPTGTMANLIAIMCHCWGRGQEILAGDMSHISLFEQGSAAQVANVHVRTLNTLPDGTFDLKEVESKINRSEDVHMAITTLLCLENTHNMCGGRVLPLKYLREIYDLASKHNVKVHMDGARVMNAAISLGVPVSNITQHCDSVSTCLSKSLGAPMGSMVAGDKEFIKRALRCRKLLGGGMRQSGIIAAAGLYAFRNMVDRLIIDHARAQQVARAIAATENTMLSIDPATVESNILIIKLSPDWNAETISRRLLTVNETETNSLGKKIAVKSSSRDSSTLRLVLHADVSQEDVELAIKKIVYIIKEENYIF